VSQAPGTSSEKPREGTLPADDKFATALRGFGLTGLLAMLLILAGNLLLAPVGAILVLLWARRSGTPWREIGYVRPASWTWTVLGGTALGVALKLLMKSVIMPLLGAPPVNPAYQFLVGNTAATVGMLWVVIVVAGWGEETLFRGYLFERLGKILGTSPAAKAAIVLLTSIVFGLLHMHDQGVAGAEQAIITGLVFGTIFALRGRIWLLIFAHAAYDVIAIAIIYGGFERDVAHWVFR
jgi:uncharacterized protein